MKKANYTLLLIAIIIGIMSSFVFYFTDPTIQGIEEVSDGQLVTHTVSKIALISSGIVCLAAMTKDFYSQYKNMKK